MNEPAIKVICHLPRLEEARVLAFALPIQHRRAYFEIIRSILNTPTPPTLSRGTCRRCGIGQAIAGTIEGRPFVRMLDENGYCVAWCVPDLKRMGIYPKARPTTFSEVFECTELTPYREAMGIGPVHHKQSHDLPGGAWGCIGCGFVFEPGAARDERKPAEPAAAGV